MQAIRKVASAVSGEKERGELKRAKRRSDTRVSSNNIVSVKSKHSSFECSIKNGSKKKVKGVLASPGDIISAHPTSPDGSDHCGRIFMDDELGSCTVAQCGKFGADYVLYYADKDGNEEYSGV